MLIIPKGTVLYEPDPIHRVILQFPTQEDAIIFYQRLCAVEGKTLTAPGECDPAEPGRNSGCCR
jgi:hypothetical protein